MKPVIYTNARFYDVYLDEHPADVTWWIMSPFIEPRGSPNWTIWQYLPGHRRGVEGRVDRNAFNGDLADLQALTERHSG